jgi:hypothetical protein
MIRAAKQIAYGTEGAIRRIGPGQRFSDSDWGGAIARTGSKDEAIGSEFWLAGTGPSREGGGRSTREDERAAAPVSDPGPRRKNRDRVTQCNRWI